MVGGEGGVMHAYIIHQGIWVVKMNGFELFSSEMGYKFDQWKMILIILVCNSVRVISGQQLMIMFGRAFFLNTLIRGARRMHAREFEIFLSKGG